MSLVGFGRVGEAVGVPAANFTTAAGTGLVISFAGGVIAMVGSLLASREMLAEGSGGRDRSTRGVGGGRRGLRHSLGYPEPPCRRRR